MWPMTGAEVVNACSGQCEFAQLNNLRIKGAITDSRKLHADDLFVAIRGDKFDGHGFVAQALDQGAALALVEGSWQGLKQLSFDHRARCVVVPNAREAFRALAAFVRSRMAFPVIGVGGSNGKTTTKEMLAALLSGRSGKVTKTEKSENGFLGVAITLCAREHAFGAMAPDALVLEIGIDDVGAMEQHVRIASPDLVLLTALGPEHLAGLGTWETAVAEEFKLFTEGASRLRRVWQLACSQLWPRLHELQEYDTLVCPRESLAQLFDALCSMAPSPLTMMATSPSLEQCLAQRRVTLVVCDVVTQTALSSSVSMSHAGLQHRFEVPLPGLHNAQNFALAFATAIAAGWTPEEIKGGWVTFQPPEMRSRISHFGNGCVLYDDCYNASPASMEAALASLCVPEWDTRQKLVVLGDMLDLGDESKKWHLGLLNSLLNLKNSTLCLYGNAMYDVYLSLLTRPDLLEQRNNSVFHLPANEDPRGFLKSAKGSLQDLIVFVKGSRGMDLGRVIAAVSESCHES